MSDGPPGERRWDVRRLSDNKGAKNIDLTTVRRMLDDGKLTAEDAARPVGDEKWRRISQFPELFDEPTDAATVAPSPVVDEAPQGVIPAVVVVEPGDPVTEVEPSAVEPAGAERVADEDGDDDDGVAMFARRRRGDSEDPDLTPMVDVTFLLVLFFMLTSAYSVQKSIEIPPPPPEEQTASQAPTLEDLQDDRIVVIIEADNRILVDDEGVAPNRLESELRDVARETGKNEVVIHPDDQAYHETFVRVYDAATAAGFDRIAVARLSQLDPFP